MTKVNSKEKSEARVDFSHFEGLPEPVQRYFKHVLTNGQPMIRTINIAQAGALRTSTDSNKWLTFEAIQSVTPLDKNFTWNAKIKFFPGMFISVEDRLEDGMGSGKVKLFSIIPIASDKNHKPLNSGALHRYLAEAVWFPTALLPESGVVWTAIDDRSALASLTVRELRVELEFRFNDENEVESVYAEGRYGQFDGGYQKRPWEGHFKDYHDINGMKVPKYGEVGWWMDGRFELVWKGEVINVSIDY